jgi:demethylmenaquinone methyltransferase/2-methoxy-6-polyprenyl-1,4-benzoquinol methylase
VALALKKRLGPRVEVTGVDFCEPMIKLAKQKTRKKHFQSPPTFLLGDCLDLPFPDNSIDVLTIAFGLRNLEDRTRGLREMLRVLKTPTGSLFVLEFSQPMAGVRDLYFLYLRWILPRLAALATGQSDAYRYLVNSIEGFPAAEALASELRSAGFSRVSFKCLSLSTVAIHHARTDAAVIDSEFQAS